jgi:hypothetical protein
MSMILLAGLASGCGTLCNLGGGFVHPESEPRIYGGLQKDVEFFDSRTRNSDSQSGGSNSKGAVAVWLAVFLGEPTLSFVGDTLTLPVTVPLQLCRENAEEKARRERLTADQTALRAPDAHESPEPGRSVSLPARSDD